MSEPFKNHFFVISGPSGVGKSTLVRRLLAEDPRLRFLVSYTTRPRRPQEVDGVDYHFVDEGAFRRLVAEGALLEHAEFNGHWYGTSAAQVRHWLGQGYDVIKDIDVQGAGQLRAQRARLGIPMRFIFILPPSWAELERRIRARGTEDPARCQARLRIAREELTQASKFEVNIVNDALEAALDALRRVIAQARASGTA